MKILKEQSLFLVLSLLVLSFPLHAVMGVGDIVSDPQSYSYYGQQLTKTIEQIKVAQETAKTALETKDLASKTVKNLQGTLRRAQDVVDKVNRLKKHISDDSLGYAENMIKDPDDASRDLKRIYGSVDRAANPTRENIEEWKELFGDDGETINGKPDWVNVNRVKNARRSDELQNAIKKSAKADALIGIQLDELEKLAGLSNGAMTQKDATDVGNAILLSMVENQQKVIELLSSMNRSIAYLAQEQTGNKKTSKVLSQKTSKEKSFEEMATELRNNSGSKTGKQITEYTDWSGVKFK